MLKKALMYFALTALLVAAVVLVCFKYIVPKTYPVFLESMSHGVLTVNVSDAVGSDDKYLVNCRRNSELVVNINPERTDKTYYSLSKLMVNGEDVTDSVSMLQYRTVVTGKMNIIAFFKRSERPESSAESSQAELEGRIKINSPFENEYLGSELAYDIKDPSVIYDDKSGYYYCFCSDNVVLRSKDLCNWTSRTAYFESPSASSSLALLDFNSFDSVKKWAREHGYDNDVAFSGEKSGRTPLAPDIVKVGDTYYLYFSLLKQEGTNEAAIFCVKTDDLEYSVENKLWTQVGLVVSSCGHHTQNGNDGREQAQYDAACATHPSVIYDGKRLFMAYGSYYGESGVSGSINLLELDPETGLLKKNSEINQSGEEISTLHGKTRFNAGVTIARPGRAPGMARNEGSLISACELVYDDESGCYYLFMTYGKQQTSYSVRVARSQEPQGPYLDFNEQNMADFAGGRRESQYDKGYMLIGGYSFEKSSGGMASYSDTGKASVGSPSVIKTEDGRWFIALMSRLYYKIDGKLCCGDKAAESSEEQLYTAAALEIRSLIIERDGWPMALPEPYAGEKAQSSIKLSRLSGNWDVIIFDRSANEEDADYVPCSTSSVVSVLSSCVISELDRQNGEQLHRQSLKKLDNGSYSMEIDGRVFTIYPTVVWDRELGESALAFTGVGENGETIWGKKNFSSGCGMYTETLYYLLELVDEQTRLEYEKKLEKISDAPSQTQIDSYSKKLAKQLAGEL